MYEEAKGRSDYNVNKILIDNLERLGYLYNSLIACRKELYTPECIKDWVQLFCARFLNYPWGGRRLYLCKGSRKVQTECRQ